MSARTLQDLWLSSFLLLPIVSLTQGWIGGVHLNFGMTKDPQPGSGKYDPHTFCSGHACTAVIINVSLTQDWTGAFLCMTKDPQPFCSEHGCTAIISLFY